MKRRKNTVAGHPTTGEAGWLAGEAGPAVSAMTAALKLLSYRQRTTAEVRKKLHAAGYAGPDIDGTIGRLIEDRYLDDEAFTRDFITSRVKNRCWGRRKIEYELGRKGVGAEIIKKALGELEDSVEVLAAEEALEKWLRKQGLSVSRPATRDTAVKAARHLGARGFSFSVIRAVIKNPSARFTEDEPTAGC
ncbi:MAG: regulatory protein RecX [Deltaproteobacteria bacterium]|nr:regulatory protein RecX [Deltaproteobacteria bacterium]